MPIIKTDCEAISLSEEDQIALAIANSLKESDNSTSGEDNGSSSEVENRDKESNDQPNYEDLLGDAAGLKLLFFVKIRLNFSIYHSFSCIYFHR